ncbi:MAG: hypothetical protein VCD66_19690 [Alphaproteobacteria bacterium]
MIVGVLDGFAVLEQIKIADNGGQYVVEIMRDATGELADGFHLLRLTQLFLDTLAIRDIDRQCDHPAIGQRLFANAHPSAVFALQLERPFGIAAVIKAPAQPIFLLANGLGDKAVGQDGLHLFFERDAQDKHLRRRAIEYPKLIVAKHHPVFVIMQADGIAHGVDGDDQLAGTFLRLHALGNIKMLDHGAGLIVEADRPGMHRKPHFGPVKAHSPGLEIDQIDAILHGLVGLVKLIDIGPGSRYFGLDHFVRGGSAKHLGERVIGEQAFGLDMTITARVNNNRDAYGTFFQNLTKALFAFTKRDLALLQLRYIGPRAAIAAENAAGVKNWFAACAQPFRIDALAHP